MHSSPQDEVVATFCFARWSFFSWDHVTVATLVRVSNKDRILTVKRDTSPQEGSGSFVDVSEDSTTDLVSALSNVSSETIKNPFGTWKLYTRSVHLGSKCH